ncbi:pickpocket protein 28-like [Toxorhynchites rutilus septentrionalis]|uniref:pickpocket protein 28-like n=1 Tax=Toxorhynchites rutilus septentrionalis TaxID=329112 RepID=UPI00247996D6|nr:pickpocket protein 28-like [Toxorhynchites rutilus septentrionalis]
MSDDSEHKVDPPTRIKGNDIDTEQKDEGEDNGPNEVGEGMFRQFLRKSSFYGLRYVFSNEFKLVERLLWFVVIVAAGTICFIGVFLCWKRMGFQLVQIVPNEDPSPIWSVPFPAVTLCAQLNQNIPDDKKVSCLGHTVPLERFCEQACWHNQCDSCKSLLTETQTENGVCYSFNSLAATDLFNRNGVSSENLLSNASKTVENWSLQNGYADYGVFLRYYPRPAVDLSGRYQLRMKLSFNEAFLHPACGDSRSVTVFIHSPADFPFKSSNGVPIEVGERVQLLPKPKVILTQHFLRFRSPQSTKCFFEGQRQLRFFRIYTQSNCELECRTNYFLEHRKCALAYMPRETGTKPCNNSYQSEIIFTKEELIQARTQNFPLSQFFVKTCNCLPSCNEIKYNNEVSKQQLSEGNDSELVIRYGEDHFYGSSRILRYGLIDFLAHSGGLISLFLGISILTIVEMFTSNRIDKRWVRGPGGHRRREQTTSE